MKVHPKYVKQGGIQNANSKIAFLFADALHALLLVKPGRYFIEAFRSHMNEEVKITGFSNGGKKTWLVVQLTLRTDPKSQFL